MTKSLRSPNDQQETPHTPQTPQPAARIVAEGKDRRMTTEQTRTDRYHRAEHDLSRALDHLDHAQGHTP